MPQTQSITKKPHTFRLHDDDVELWKVYMQKESRPSLTNWIENACNMYIENQKAQKAKNEGE